jgi:gephyrin
VLEPQNRRVSQDLLGTILAEDVHSRLDLPSTMTTNVDGYAVSSASTSAGTYPVLSSNNYPGNILSDALPAGHIYRINTGGPLPEGTDAVVMVEDTELFEADEHTKEEKTVKLLCKVPLHENVRKPGTDVKKGDLVLEKGTRFSEVGGELGSLVFIGRKEVSHKDMFQMGERATD